MLQLSPVLEVDTPKGRGHAEAFAKKFLTPL